MIKRLILNLVLVWFVSGCMHTALACNVPVFRYALERWEPDRYSLVIYTKGPLPTADSAVIANLTNKSKANVALIIADVNTPLSPALQKALGSSAPSRFPWMVLHGPTALGHTAITSGPLDTALISRIMESPARKELIRRIERGETAIMVCVLSGDVISDKRACDSITVALAEANQSLKIPVPQGPGPVAHTSHIPLRIRFSVIFIRAGDPVEMLLVSLLKSTHEYDPKDKGPMASLFFGRGRILQVMQGKGITRASILSQCQFLCGSCSCTVKASNPGVDALIDVDWKSLIQDGGSGERGRQVMTGMTTLGDPSLILPSPGSSRPQSR